MTVVILLLIGLILFGLSYIAKRRYGVLGLGLTAGLVLSQEVSKEVANFLQYVDFPVDPLPFVDAARVALILIPSLVMLFSGPRYTDQRYAVIGSALFAIYGVVLLLAPVVANVQSADRIAIQPFISAVAANTSTIVAIGITAAVIDVLHSQGKSSFGKRSKH